VALDGAIVVLVAVGVLAVVRVVVAGLAFAVVVVVDEDAPALNLAPELHAASSSTAMIASPAAMVNDRR
jgi:hypothetical protein